MSQLEHKIRVANKAGRTAVIPFITAGFPDPASFWHHLEEIDQAGADIIEIGVPFSDPVADGPVVEAASVRALANGVNLKGLIADLTARAGKFRAGLVLMGYYNPFFQYGLGRLARDAAKAGVQGFIIPDLPFEEAQEARTVFAKEGIALVPLVGPNTSAERMRLYAKDASGYVYVVSVLGTTGERKKLAANIENTLCRAKEIFDVPVALGFGLRKPEQIAFLTEKARPDAAVIGSALLTHLENGGSSAEFLAPWL